MIVPPEEIKKSSLSQCSKLSQFEKENEELIVILAEKAESVKAR